MACVETPKVQTAAERPTEVQRSKLLRSNEGGAAAVEFAIILPVLVGIIVGMLEFSLLLKNVALTGSAVNGAARLASVESRRGQYQQRALDSVVSVLSRNNLEADKIVVFKVDKATGLPLNGAAKGGAPIALSDPLDFSTCVAECFVWSKGASGYEAKINDAAVEDPKPIVQWPWWKQSACGGSDDTDYLGVWIEFRHKYVTPMFGDERRIRKVAVYRLEPVAYANAEECDGSQTPAGTPSL